MARYEMVEGTARKFWEIALKGKTVEVHFGRIGTDGQTQLKSFGSPAEARAKHDRLVAEKTKKGYRLAGSKDGRVGVVKGTSATPDTTPRTKSKTGDAGLPATCEAIERYLDRLLAAKISGLTLRPSVLAPQKVAAIALTEKKLGAPLQPDLKAFLTRGVRYPSGSVAEPFATIGFDFLSADKIASHTAMLRKVADDTIEDEADAHAALIRRSVAVTYEEPELVVAPDGVYHFSYRNPLLRVASSWTEFMAHWLAGGCFSSHSFDALWTKVKALVPADISPSKNVWVRAYRKQFPNL